MAKVMILAGMRKGILVKTAFHLTYSAWNWTRFSIFLCMNLYKLMMKTDISRRSFISRGSCAACCLIIGSPALLSATGRVDSEINPDDYTYCGYKCTPECPLLKATTENDEEQKKKVFEEWGVAEKHGIEFNAEDYFCHGCKNIDEPPGFPVRHCTIIPCARKKGYEACFQCRELDSCEKEIWVKYPQHREYVLGLQETYFAGLD
jgi:hypothetical protein